MIYDIYLSVYLQTDHQQLLACRCERLCRICVDQIQPRKHVLSIDQAEYTGSTRQHEL